jgi:hypothetical protein
MEIQLTATFSNMYDLERAVGELRRQGVLDIRFDDRLSMKVDFQTNTFIQSLEDNHWNTEYGLHVTVEKSRFRQAEDILTNCGARL